MRISTVCCENMAKSSLVQGRGSPPRHVHGLLKNFTPMWAFCQWGAAAVWIPEGLGEEQWLLSQASFSENTVLSSLRNFPLTLLVDQLQLGVSNVELSHRLDGYITGESEPDAATQDPGSHLPRRTHLGFLWPRLQGICRGISATKRTEG